MSLHELNKINKIVGGAVKALHDSEKFSVGVLAVRARKIAEAFPNDPTSVAMYNFLNKRANFESLISRAEFRNVYNKLFSKNNKFGGLFTEELGITELPKPKLMQREAGDSKNFIKEAYKNLANPILTNALSEIFDQKGINKPYSVSIAKSAARTCLHELNRFAAPSKIDVVAGQVDLLICQASYETPKGWCSVLLPVEIKEGTALLPTVFLGKLGFMDLSKETLEQHIKETAGKNFKIDVQQLLHEVVSAKNGVKSLSEMEMIIAKAKAASGNSHDINNILYQEIDKVQPLLEPPQTDETEKFANRLSTSTGIAEFKFGKSVVDKARNLLKMAMNEFGYPHANITVCNADDATVYFAVSVDNRAAFKIPMKISGKKEAACFYSPEIVISAGSIYSFSKSGISKILSSGDPDQYMMAVASPAYGLKPSELIEQVRIAIAEGDIPRAEDALIVLQQSDSPSFKEALTIYQAGFGGQVKTASQQPCCAKQRKVAYSKYMICGHTNLPIHKVYQDQNGDCHPTYRKSICEAEGGSFMHSKVYFG